MKDKIREEFEKKFNTDYMAYDDRFDRYVIHLEKGESVVNVNLLSNEMNILNAKWQGYKSRDEEVEKLSIENDKLKNILRFDHVWDMISILRRLLEGVDILLHKYDYDGDCWEQIDTAWKQGVETLKEIDSK